MKDRTTIEDLQKLADKNHPGLRIIARHRTEASNDVEVYCSKHDHTFIVKLPKLRKPSITPLCSYSAAQRDKSKTLRETKYNQSIEAIKKNFPDLTFEKTRESYERNLRPGKAYKVTVTCPKHGDFEARFYHIKDFGCMQCRDVPRKNQTNFQSYKNKEELCDLIKKIHGDSYDLSQVEYVKQNFDNKITLGCKHGFRKAKITTVLNGGGCFYCSSEKVQAQKKEGTFKSWWTSKAPKAI